MKQQTIKESFQLVGKGLHGGHTVTLTFHPAQEGHGVKFQRVDLEDKPVIEAIASNVNETQRGTTIKNFKGVEVKTIEHVMAALVGCDVDNVLVEIDSDEVPILDGSSILVAQAIEKAGVVEQEKERNIYVLKEVIRYEDKSTGVELIAIPSEIGRASCRERV